MNLEILSQRMIEIDAAIQRVHHEFNVLSGQKNEVNHWIAQINDAQVKVIEDSPATFDAIIAE